MSRFALFDERCARVAETLRGNPELATEAREICAKLEVLAQARRMESNAIQVAVAAFMSRMRTPPPVEPRGARPASDVPPAIASRWLRSATLIGEQAEEMEALLDHIPNERWRARLAEYADQLRTVAESTPWERLSRLAEVEEAKPEEPGVLDPGVFDAIGFVAPDAVALPPAEAIEHCQRLVPQLNSEAAHLENLARAVSRHPAARLHEREAELMRAAARHELARALEKPIGEAEATVLVRVIGEGLGNVFAELVAALTRFEWYFERVKLRARRDSMAFEGMVTDREKLQLRMLLNAGESAIVGLAWFLALHVLQEKAQRRVLLLDDPFGGLDANNRAAVLATLRAFARLCAPAFFMVSTHDEGFGDLLEREFCASATGPAVSTAFASSAGRITRQTLLR